MTADICATQSKTALPGLTVESRPIGDLKLKRRNARKHSLGQIERLSGAIESFGFVAPIVIGSGDIVLAGEARLAAAKRVGLEAVPTISLAHLKPQEQKAYMLADNQLATLATWDDVILSKELIELQNFELDFSLDVLGFSDIDLSRLTLLDGSQDPESAVEEDEPPAMQSSAVTRLGDVWMLGDHRLICGDARDNDAYNRLMQGKHARMVFTDPPYNCPVKGHITRRDSQAREFPMATGEMTSVAFTDFLSASLGQAAAHAMDGSIHYVFMDWRNVAEVVQAGQSTIGPMKNLIVWAKPNAGMGNFYRSQHELVFVFKKGDARHINTFGLGEGGRYRTNVWTYPGASGFHAERDDDLAMHVTPKPVAMIADAILDVSRKGEIVLDPFGGSGSTLMAAEKTGRRARLIELDPLYCDVICRRFLRAGGQVVRESDGASFNDVASGLSGPLLLEGPADV